MTYPLVRAVSAPTLDADVLFDFNDHGSWSSAATSRGLADGWSLGVPQRLSGFGDPRTAWGPRKVEFAIEINGNRASALAAQSRLARWLLRPDGWVMFQLDALTRPVWLRMLGAQPQDLSFDRVYVDRQRDTWTLGCSFDAEPFMYGERITLPEVTLSQDVTGSPWFETPVIEGDAPSRLRLAGASDTFMRHFLLAGIPLDVAALEVWQAGTGDGFTAGADTSTGADTEASGGSVRTVSFATDATRVTRVSGTAPSPVMPGLYRALVRARASASGSVITSTLAVGGATSDVVSWTGSTFTWQDFGLFQLPRGSISLPDVDLPDSAPTFTFAAGRTSGTATLSVDAVLLVPVTLLEDPAESTMLSWLSGTTVTELVEGFLIDGDYEVGRAFHSGGTFAPTSTAAAKTFGGWPEVVPGRVNAVMALGLDTIGVSQSIDVTASYMPRWLYLPSEAE